jgi:gp16 family phage-associated protein
MNDKNIEISLAMKTTTKSTLVAGTVVAISIEEFRSVGGSIADWARSRGFSTRLTYSILRQERKCLRGQSLLIARELGMK